MRLNHVTVAVRDIERATRFYRTLGLELVVHAAHYARFVCPDGGSTLSIHRSEPAPDRPVASSTVVYFECEDLDATVARLALEGMRFDAPPTDRAWLWREARLADPDGNPICLFHAGRNRIDPPWRVAQPTGLA